MQLTKKKLFTVLGLFTALILMFSVYATFSRAGQKVIVISPGHSVGYDSGAVSQYIEEAQVNQLVAEKVTRQLTQKGYKVYITHTTNPEFNSQKLLNQEDGSDLRTTGAAINRINPDVTMVIHHNSGGADASGYELYWSSYRSFDTNGVYEVDGLWGSGSGYRDTSPCLSATESKRFADILKNSLYGQARLGFRKIVERDDYLPAHTYSPCVLYEGGFLSNPSEAQFLATETYQNDAANRITNAIVEFLNTTSYVPSENPYAAGSQLTQTKIEGTATVTASQLAAFYNNHSVFPDYYKNRGVSLEQFAQMYIEEGRTENIRADLAFAQAMLETGFLKFGGDVSISQFNFAGIGATGGGNPGYNFAATYGDNATGIRMGIRAQIQHLKAYGSKAALRNAVVDPRFSYVTRGSALTLNDLAGKWAADKNYATKIAAFLGEIPGSTSGTTTSTPSTGVTPADISEPLPPATGPNDSITIYRLYNPKTGEHLYTSDRNEAQVLSSGTGWKSEGAGWYAPKDGTPIYRLYNGELDNHLYTSDQNEIDTLIAEHGWVMDNNDAPLFYSGGETPIYRLYNEGIRGLHHLTTDLNEYNVLPEHDWQQEGVALNAVAVGK